VSKTSRSVFKSRAPSFFAPSLESSDPLRVVFDTAAVRAFARKFCNLDDTGDRNYNPVP